MKDRAIYLGVAILLIAAVSVCVFLLHGAHGVAAQTRAVLAQCDTGATDHAPCYETVIPQLYPQLSVPQLFAVVRAVRDSDSSYQFCHVLAHKIGERVVAEDPDRWIDAIPLNPPDGFCSNGFIHGVIGGRFSAEVLDEKTIAAFVPDFKRACEPHDGWNPSDLDKSICYHGMGHLYDFITDANLPEALRLCTQTVPEQFGRVCVEGVFMQIYQPLEPDDYALVARMKTKPSATSTRSFCAAFKEPEYVGACLRESWPLHKGMLDGTGVESLCANQPSAELEDRCYQSAYSIIGRLKLAEPDVQAHACDIAPEPRRAMCYSVVADAVLEENRTDARRAVSFCLRAGDAAGPCLSYLVGAARFNFGADKKEYDAFCDALPGSMRNSCKDGTASPESA